MLAVLLVLGGRAVADDEPSHTPTCGDGVIEGDEECDDGNDRIHDGCDASCRVEPLWGCGDTVLTDAQACDDDGELCMPACPVDTFNRRSASR